MPREKRSKKPSSAPRDPSDDDRRRSSRDDDARRGGGGAYGRDKKPSGSDKRASRDARDLDRQLLNQQSSPSKRPTSGGSGGSGRRRSRSKERGRDKDEEANLDHFVGSSARNGKSKGDRIGPLGSSMIGGASEGQRTLDGSELTTPSVLMRNDHDDVSEAMMSSVDDNEDEYDEKARLLPGGKGDKRDDAKKGGRGGNGSRKVGFGLGMGRGRGSGNGASNGGDRNSRFKGRRDTKSGSRLVDRGFESSALSMRKKPWFATTETRGSLSDDGKGSVRNGASRSFSTSTGVKYRSATSTQRALEDLRRRRLEARERRRAATVLACLLAIAGAAHLAGSDGGIMGFFTGNGGTRGMAGSRDKAYGETKDLGYGGERMGADGVPQVGVAAGVPAAGGVPGIKGGDNGEEDYEYRIPEAKEKEYDEEHEFLLPLRHFADVTEPARPTDTAFFFHVPRAGGSTFKDIAGKCLSLVQSSEVGVRDGHGTDPKLEVLNVQESQYVNVDTTTIPGIQRAVDLGLAPSGLADLVVSSYLHESAALFDLGHQGRAFIMLRDPIERATSMYWHRVKEVGDLEDSVTVEDYAQGNGIENNWMCRFLANRMTGELTKEDLEQAKEILKEKFLLGFVDDYEESVFRIVKYSGWSFSTDETDRMMEEDCIRDLAGTDDDGNPTGGSNINPYEYEIPNRGSQAHALISWQTQFDSKLYAYAKELFEKQTKEWGTKERKKALKKEKKKKGG